MVWQSVYNAVCACYQQTWVNSSQIFGNITASTSPIAALNNVINNQLPWFWPAFPFVLYIWMLSLYSDSPTGGKLFMITGIVFVICAFMAIGGYLIDAIINFLIFIVAFVFSGLFKKPSVGG